jgi:uncharacterized membrane protein YfcA
LFGAAFAAGAINSVAGGGSFISFPALLFTGVHEIIANATNTVALWPAGLSSAFAYRKDMRFARATLVALGAASLAGGLAGALLLLRTPDAAFRKLLPWLMLAGALIFTFGSAITTRLRAKREASGKTATSAGLIAAAIVQLLISIYGGYFGGGMGIMMLATLSMMGMTNIHEMNGLKTLLGTLINGVGVVTFVVARSVDWRSGWMMILGATLGGYAGAAIARRIEPKWIRRLVIAIAWSMTTFFFARPYF